VHGNSENGFTLVEVLVVIIVIGILTAIAIPSYLKQREKAWQAAAVSDLRNAASAVESLAAQYDGDYSRADGMNESSAALDEEGFNNTEWVSIEVHSTATEFCIAGENQRLPGRAFVFRSTTGAVDVGDPDLVACA